MKKLFFFFLITISLSLVLTNCRKDDDSDVTTTVNAIVYHKYVPLKLPLNDNEIDALQIKESHSNNWIIVTGIEGFNYEENNEYHLKLEKTVLANPPMDSGDTRYKLIQIISKTPR